jgi:transposase-like protein
MSGPDPEHPTPALTCPFCGSGAVERVGQWGGQLITSQWRCRDCDSYFEALREDYAAARVTSSSDPK